MNKAQKPWIGITRMNVGARLCVIKKLEVLGLDCVSSKNSRFWYFVHCFHFIAVISTRGLYLKIESSLSEVLQLGVPT